MRKIEKTEDQTFSEVNKDIGNSDHYYREIYNQTLYASGISSWLMKQTHLRIERGTRKKQYSKVLEIGSGTGQHLDFVTHPFDYYFCLEVKQTALKPPHSSNPKIIQVQGIADSLPFPDATFDRVITTCVLHHLEKPEEALAELRRVLKPGGRATIYLSCDPSFLIRLVRHFTAERKARQLGFEGYSLFIAREHRNHFLSLHEIARYIFRDDSTQARRYPFRMGSWNLNAFIVLDVIKN
jgi:ubiquinone/menaquinone biosynthesis C-methylase UbiE